MSDSPRPSSAFNLEFLKKEAKALLRACRAQDDDVVTRVRARLTRLTSLPPADIAAAITLADVQQLLALEAGYRSWADLKRHGDALEEFLALVRGGAYGRLVEKLPRFASLAPVSIHAACALGDRRALDTHLERDPTLIAAEHRGWAPIIYACASLLHRLTRRHAEGLLDCVEVLLDRGVDPNTATRTGNGERISAVQRAGFRFSGNVPILALLYNRGAAREKPVPAHPASQGLEQKWHAVFEEYGRSYPQDLISKAMATAREQRARRIPPSPAPDPRQAFRGTPTHTTAIQPVMWSAAEHSMREMQGEAALALGVALFYPQPLVELVLANGLDLNVRAPDGRSVVALATRAGRSTIASLLQKHGGSAADVSLSDQLVGACLALDKSAVRQILDIAPDVPRQLTVEDVEILLRAASTNGLAHIRLMLDAGWPVDSRGESGATALHVAAWHGYPELVELLVTRGASRASRDAVYRQTPLEWAVHGSTHGRNAPEDYRTVIARLRAGLQLK
jgi:ankyrin repeat protein